MKNLKILLVAIVLIFGMSFITTQSNIAHINTQDLVEEMPAMKSAKREIESLSIKYQNDIDSMSLEYQAKVKKYEDEVLSNSLEENRAILKDITGIEQMILQQQAFFQQELGKKEANLLEPILKRAKDAVIKVANDQGIDYVFDATPGQGVIHAKGKDLLADVKRELGF